MKALLLLLALAGCTRPPAVPAPDLWTECACKADCQHSGAGYIWLPAPTPPAATPAGECFCIR